MTYLVDTNVLSELARPGPDPGVVEWASRTQEMALSVITVDEILFGLSRRPNQRVRSWFETFLDSYCTVLAVDEQIARRSAVLRARLAASGRARTQADMMIAATAELHGLTLVTRNVRDFGGCPIAVLNPFTGSG